MERFFSINDTFSVKYPVTCEDIDQDYALKLTSAAAYFQDTVASFMTTRQVAAFDMIKEGIIWVVSDITYKAGSKVAMWREEVTSEMKLTEISAFRAYFDYCLKGEDGSVLCSGTGIWAPVNLTTMRPSAISDFCEIRKLGDGTAAVKHDKLRYIPATQQILEASYPVTSSELDFNRHMCNRAYIDFALRGMPEEFKNTHMVKEYMIKFVRQTYLGDIVTCRYYQSQDNCDLYLVRLLNSAGEEVSTMQIEWMAASQKINDFSTIVKR